MRVNFQKRMLPMSWANTFTIQGNIQNYRQVMSEIFWSICFKWLKTTLSIWVKILIYCVKIYCLCTKPLENNIVQYLTGDFELGEDRLNKSVKLCQLVPWTLTIHTTCGAQNSGCGIHHFSPFFICTSLKQTCSFIQYTPVTVRCSGSWDHTMI